MDAEQALHELLEVSPQIRAVVIATRDGSPVASSWSSGDERTTRLSSLSQQILAAADTARTELGREPVVQAEIATGTGHVFVVADDARVVAAATGLDPTVGLVFYDLKTALRSIREGNAAATTGGGGTASKEGPKS